MVKNGQEIDEETHKKLMRDTKKRYTKALDPRHAAARLWVDAIIRPQDTRTVLIRALSGAAHNTEVPPFRTGVLQA
jgi:acetyl-CoA carboxylase carboxyltransferase component